MERELEKDLREIEYLIYVHKERENTHTQSVLERAHEIIEPCAKAARTLPELEELLSRENGPEITRSSRDNDVTEYCPHCDREITVSWNVERDELEKILEEIDETIERYGKNPYIDGKVTDLCYGMNIAKDIIRKHMNDGWIPVEERLPEEYGEYLVTIVPSAGYLWAKRIIANFSDLMGIVKKPIFYTGEVGKIDFEDITDMVIAWRPLPEPHRPERSNDEKE